jgi:hypothetical protein
MIDWNTLRDQTLAYRRSIAELLKQEVDRADIRPPTWNNTLHWHAGHLVLTPHTLTYAMLNEPLPLPESYRGWFAKGTGPTGWGNDAVPDFEMLVGQIVAVVPPIFENLQSRAEEPFPAPYATSVGIVLRTPAQALNFSMAHDAMHLGMIQALRRALDGMRT